MLKEHATHDVSLKNSREVMVIPLDLPAGRLRQEFLFEVLSNDTKSMDQCGLDIAVDVFDEISGESRGRHTPFSTGYRPQFYFRTTDVTGNSAPAR